LTSYVIDGTVAIDAGCIGFYQGPTEQARILHVFITHSHIDHVASLPIFLENVVGLGKAPVIVYASEAVQESLRLDVFNGRLWPDFLKLTYGNNIPFVKLQTISSGKPVDVAGLRITPVSVHHVVPTLGFIIEGPTGAIVIPSDTGPTEEIWQRAQKTPNLKAVFLEATFPAGMVLADIAMHLTSSTFVREMHKLPLPVTYFAVHLKAQFRERVAAELLAHRMANVAIAESGKVYEF